MSPEIEQFIKENIGLIEQNTKESWEELYKKFPPRNFTETLLEAGIDPALTLEYLPNNYLFHSDIEFFDIPDNCKYIGFGAFKYCYNLKTIQIPNNVEAIETYSFSSCRNLEEIFFNRNLKEIFPGAFDSCENLKTIDLSNTSLVSIGEEAFCSCSNLMEVILPNSLINLNDKLFRNCNLLTEVIYKGSKREAIIKLKVKNKNWRKYSAISKIICTDGIIEL